METNTYAYHELSGEDLPQLKGLLKVFSEAFGDPASYQSAVPDDQYLRTFLDLENAITLVVRSGDDVVAGLVAYEFIKFEQARREIYIYDLAVLEPHRRKGLATGLINELKRIAKKRGAYVIMVQADPGDDPAIRLYESLGTREDVHHFDILP